MRLGDLDELKERISSYAGLWTDEGFMVGMTAVLNGIDFQQTIDAEPVVRCKECRYYYHSVSSFRDGRCAHFGNFDGDPCVDLNAFCSYGERKDGEG